jgi:betaine-aldehyde dehydrogenase
VRRARAITFGGPFDELAETGPLISAARREKFRAYVQAGVAKGITLLCGDYIPDSGALALGSNPPTILDGCHTSMKAAQDESFGPILTAETFRAEQEAITLANDTAYGLAGAVWTNDGSHAQRVHSVAAALRHGTVRINGYYPHVPQAERGGFGKSGNGRELRLQGLAEYRETKHIWQNVNPKPSHWFEPTQAGVQQ